MAEGVQTTSFKDLKIDCEKDQGRATSPKCSSLNSCYDPARNIFENLSCSKDEACGLFGKALLDEG